MSSQAPEPPRWGLPAARPRHYPLVMLDLFTLRIVTGGVSIVVLALFYLAVYRPTRSAFSMWWSLSLVCAGATALLLLGDNTSWQFITNPASTVASAIGCTCVWYAGRSLRALPNPRWVMVAAPVACLAAALIDDPVNNIWAGNGLLFSVMAALFVLGAIEVWRGWAERRTAPDAATSSAAIMGMFVVAVSGTIVGFMQTLRAVLFLVDGPDGNVFKLVTGSAVAAMIMIVTLVAVTFSISAIGWDQGTRELRRRADEDDLTGLLGRSMFLARVREAIAASGGRRGRIAWLAIADLDNFKPINDEHGHLAGDRVLLHFAEVARHSLRDNDAVGRLGGDEFGFVIDGAQEDTVLARLEELRARLAKDGAVVGDDVVTASFGVARCEPHLSLSEMLARADAALYEAKRGGRDRVAVYSG